MSSKNVDKKEDKIKETKSKENKKEKEKSKIKNEEENSENEYPKDKINKPNELKNFDAVTHFKQNIIHFNNNCAEPIKDYSYYCFTCKHSVCNECGVSEHKNHLLIQRDNCLNYDNSFFNEISKVIEKGINIDSKKSQIKKDISKSIYQLKEQLDLIEQEKLKEIDNIFKEIKANYVSLKDNYLKTKECIENYYKTNKKFFNIKIKHTKQNSQINTSTDNKENKENNENNENKEKNNTNANTNSIKSSLINYYNVNENELGPNRDIENTIFLMNFELMNLCDNKNLQILEISNNINKKIKDMSKLIEDNTKSFTEELKKNYLSFDNGIIQKFDDFYWDIKVRCEKYTEHKLQFQNTIHDIYKRNGCLDKLKDLLSLFDSKNNKGKDVLFNQQFFIKMNDLSSLSTDVVKNMAKKLYLSNGKIRSTSKNRFANKSKFSSSGTLSEKKDENKKSVKALGKTKSNNILNVGNKDGNKDNINENKELELKNELKKNLTNMGKNTVIPKKENIILNQRLIQRFYSYSILDFYTKYFKVNINTQDKDYDEEKNIYLKNNNSNIDGIRSKKGTNLKYSKNVGVDDSKNTKNKFKNNIKSVSLLSNYTARYTELKEKAKPIINTNYIQLYDPATTKITKIKVNLDTQDKDYDEENNIYMNNKYNNSSNIDGKNTKKGYNNLKYGKVGGGKGKNDNNANNSNMNDPKNMKNRYKTNIKSVSLLSNYTERYTELKEKVKPIINTNYIQLFDPATTRISKIKVPLTKEEHGYTTFPDGCRHLLIDSDLYITGGTDNCGYPINIVLIYNLAIGELNRLSNLNDNHSYHSVEYLENFDSILVVGGENSSSCEIMDLDSKKWTKLPSLNYPRANSNIYYNNMTSDLFVLFGMEGEMNQKTKNTDVIEVLELNDIISGWMMVDYYKSVGLDLKNNYCITLPFTRDKLLIYGGSSARSIEKRLFALFDMIKNECIKVDSETMDLIKREENKIRAFDNALEIIN